MSGTGFEPKRTVAPWHRPLVEEGGKGNGAFGGTTHQGGKFTPGPLTKVRAQDFRRAPAKS